MGRSLLRAFADRRPRNTRRMDGMVVVPCEGADRDLCVVWDPIEEQIVEVLPRRFAARYGEEDDLWLEARSASDADTAGWAAAA